MNEWSSQDLLPEGAPFAQQSSAVIEALCAQTPRRVGQLMERVLQVLPSDTAVFSDEDIQKMGVVFPTNTAQYVLTMQSLLTQITLKSIYHSISADNLHTALQGVGFSPEHAASIVECVELNRAALTTRLQCASGGGQVLSHIYSDVNVVCHTQHLNGVQTPCTLLALHTAEGTHHVQGGIEQFLLLHNALEQAQHTVDKCMR